LRTAEQIFTKFDVGVFCNMKISQHVLVLVKFGQQYQTLYMCSYFLEQRNVSTEVVEEMEILILCPVHLAVCLAVFETNRSE
jgi:hypothetical protein